MVVSSDAITKGPVGNISDLSNHQKTLFLDLAINGPTDIYSAHKRNNIKQSTAQVSMKRLDTLHLVNKTDSITSDKGGIKNIYSLTLPGLLVAIDMLLYSTNGRSAEEFVKTLNNWKPLCPEVIDKWNFLTQQNQCKCPRRPNPLFISLQNDHENYWAVTLWKAAITTYQEFLKQNTQVDSLPLEFLDNFIDTIIESIEFGIDDLNVDPNDYRLCVLKQDAYLWRIVNDAIQIKSEFYGERTEKLAKIKGGVSVTLKSE